MAMQIFVTIVDSGKKITLDVESSDSIEHIRTIIDDKEGIAPSVQQLTFMSTILVNGNTLDYYSIGKEDTLFLSILTANRASPITDNSTYAQLSSHLAISRRFTQAQMNNIWSHVDSLHDNFSLDNNRLAFDLNANDYQDVYRMLKQVGYDLTINKRKNRSIAARFADSTDPVQLASNTIFSDIITDIPTVPDMGYSGVNGKKSINDTYFKNLPLSVWGTGSLEYGSVDLTGNTQHFSSRGVTVGIDSQFHPNLIIGSAIGYGFGKDKLDNLGSQTKSDQVTTSLYMSYLPSKNWSIDGILGYGNITLDNQRWTTLNTEIVEGKRDGHISFGTFSLNRVFNLDMYRLRTFVRGDITKIKLNNYDEFNSESALSYQSVTSYAKSSSVGSEILCDLPIKHGRLTSSIALQYTHNFSGDADQDMYYSSLGSDSTHYNLSIEATPVSTVSLGTNLKYINSEGHSIDLAYTALNGSNSYRASRVNLTARLTF
jgi:hypothetical protein